MQGGQRASRSALDGAFFYEVFLVFAKIKCILRTDFFQPSTAIEINSRYLSAPSLVNAEDKIDD